MKKILVIIVSYLLISCFENDRSIDKAAFVSDLKGKIVFTTPLDDPRGHHLMKVTINEISDTIIIAPHEGDLFSYPKWSPNGKHLLYITRIGPFEGSTFAITNETGSYGFVLGSSLGVFGNLSWSPTGSFVLIGSSDGPDYIQDTLRHMPLVALFPDSISFDSDWLFVTPAGSRWTESDLEVFVMASPNRSSRYFESGPDSLREIYRYDYSSDIIVERVTHNRLDEFGFEISSDHQRIVFSTGTGESKVTYLMNISDTTAKPIIEGKHETVRWFGKTHYLYYVRFPNPTVYVMDTDHPEKEYELMRVYDANIDIWAQPDSTVE